MRESIPATNLKHIGLTTTPPGLLLDALAFVSYLILVFYILTKFEPSSSSKQLVSTCGNQSVPFKLETDWLDLLTTTPPELLLDALSFLPYLILVFYILTNFEPSSSSKQSVNTCGNRSQPLKLETHWPDHYTTRVIAGCSCFSIILNPCLLYFNQI